MNIVVVSAFRNMVGPRMLQYFDQVQTLQSALQTRGPHTVRIIAGEGDSTDKTRHHLGQVANSLGLPIEIIDCSHGGPIYGSTEAPSRMKALSYVCNTMLSAVREEDDIVLYVESDLVWDAFTACLLINAAVERESGFDIFAPMIFAGKAFYDIWGFRKYGQRFNSLPPYHQALTNGHPVELDSAGSCLVMRGEIARKVRITNDYALVGWCENARAQGYKIAVHPQLWITHP